MSKAKKEHIDKLINLDSKALINSSYFNKYMKIGTNNEYRKLFLAPLTKKELQKIEINYINLSKALNKLAKHTIKTNDQNILKQLHLKDLDVGSINKRSLKMLFNYARIDSVYSKNNSFKILEYNARRAQMYEDTDWLNYKLIKQNITKNKPSLTTEIINNIYKYLQLNNVPNPNNII